MVTVAASFTEVGAGNQLLVPHKSGFTYDISGTFTGTWVIQKSENGGKTWETYATGTAAASATITSSVSQFGGPAQYRAACTAYTSGTIVTSLADANDTIREFVDHNGATAFAIKEQGATGISTEGLETAAEAAGLLKDSGCRALSFLILENAVAEGDTVQTGDDVYEFEVVTTDTTDDTDDGDFDNEYNPLTLVGGAAAYANVDFTVGALVRVEDEIMRVSVGGADPVLLRGQSGTTIAAHADAEDILQGDGIAMGSTVAVGLMADLTDTAARAALIADFNEHNTISALAQDIDTGTEGVFFRRTEVGDYDGDTVATLDDPGDVFVNATFVEGRASRLRELHVMRHVVTAGEEAAGRFFHSVPYEAVVVGILIRQTATPGLPTDFDGAATVVEDGVDGSIVIVDNNGGSENLTENDIVTLVLTDAD